MPKASHSLRCLIFAGILAAALPTCALDTRALAMEPAPEKDLGTAYLWALGGTVAPTLLGTLLLATEESALIVPGFALILGGTVMGPSYGQFYAGSLRQGWAGAGIRGVGAGFVLYGLALMVGKSMNGCDDEFSDCMKDVRPPLVFGSLTYAVGLGYSLFQTWRAVHPREVPPRTAISLEPTLVLGPLGSWSPGLRASLHL